MALAHAARVARKIARTSTLAIACCAPIATIWVPVMVVAAYEEGGEVLAVGERERAKGAGGGAGVGQDCFGEPRARAQGVDECAEQG
jgi:hypothetical protein